jgi:hypothetical protein
MLSVLFMKRGKDTPMTGLPGAESSRFRVILSFSSLATTLASSAEAAFAKPRQVRKPGRMIACALHRSSENSIDPLASTGNVFVTYYRFTTNSAKLFMIQGQLFQDFLQTRGNFRSTIFPVDFRLSLGLAVLAGRWSGALDGRVGVITGGSSGIALKTAKLFAAEAKVVLTDCRRQAIDDAPDLLERRKGQLGPAVLSREAKMVARSATVGARAPNFSLPITMGPRSERRLASLADYQDRWLVLLFYPRDFSLV